MLPNILEFEEDIETESSVVIERESSAVERNMNEGNCTETNPDIETGKHVVASSAVDRDEDDCATMIFCDCIYKDCIRAICSWIALAIDAVAHRLCLNCGSKVFEWCYDGLSRSKEKKATMYQEESNDKSPWYRLSDRKKKKRAVGNAGTCEVCCAWLIILPLCKVPIDCLRGGLSMENDL